MRREEDDEGLSLPSEPSRSQRRREALSVLALAHALAESTDATLEALPLDAELRERVRETRRITAQIARKRELQFLAKQLRRLDEHELEAIRAALEHDRGTQRRETAALHRIERWRERMITDPDATLAELAADHPGLDRQHLRQLARRAREERVANKPPAAARALFKALREALGHAGDEATSVDDDPPA